MAGKRSTGKRSTGKRNTSGRFARVYALVRRIPEGRVATYGQVARWLGWTRGARTVGWALRALSPGSGVPWHRVVNAQGRISQREVEAQRERLEAEGVLFDESGRIDLDLYGWIPPLPATESFLTS
jgi:methylated-DNA-protein-cysteine methyltransferase-like protein